MNDILRPSPDALIGLLDDVTTILTPLPFVRKILCFGSFARGTWDCWSDIDLVVVTDTRSQFVDILETLQDKKPILHRNHFVSHTEPCGGHILGIIFQGMSVFHNIDLNLLTWDEYQTAGSLERFGKMKNLYTSGSSAVTTDSADIPSEQEDSDEARIKIGVHFTKKAAKKILRGERYFDDLRRHAEYLSQTMKECPAFAEQPIGLLAQTYLQIAELLLSFRG